jgi:uncharacterized protein
MLPFEEKISNEIKDAMRARDQVRLDCLRAMKSALKYKFVEKSQQDLTEDEAYAVFNTLIKQRRDAAEQFAQFGKTKEADKERREIEVIKAYLPQQLSEEELKKFIQESISASGATSQRDLGKVMKELKAKVAGKADMKVVTELVKQSLPAA